MPSNLEDFEGIYQISQGSVTSDPADPRSPVNPENKVVLSRITDSSISFSIVDANDQVLLGPIAFDFYAGSQMLTFTDPDYNGSGQPLTAQVSLYRDAQSSFKSIYGVMIYADPENVGVWGADILPS